MTSLYIHEAGDPADSPIVVLHGGGLSGRMWQPQMDALAEFHCLAPGRFNATVRAWLADDPLPAALTPL